MTPEQVMQRLVGVGLEKRDPVPLGAQQTVLTFREGIWQTQGGDATVYLQDEDGALFWVRVKKVSP